MYWYACIAIPQISFWLTCSGTTSNPRVVFASGGRSTSPCSKSFSSSLISALSTSPPTPISPALISQICHLLDHAPVKNLLLSLAWVSWALTYCSLFHSTSLHTESRPSLDVLGGTLARKPWSPWKIYLFRTHTNSLLPLTTPRATVPFQLDDQKAAPQDRERLRAPISTSDWRSSPWKVKRLPQTHLSLLSSDAVVIKLIPPFGTMAMVLLHQVINVREVVVWVFQTHAPHRGMKKKTPKKWSIRWWVIQHVYKQLWNSVGIISHQAHQRLRDQVYWKAGGAEEFLLFSLVLFLLDAYYY